MLSAAGLSEATRQILNNLSSSGSILSLVATTIINIITSQITFIDENSNSLTQE
jgi:hypothetical protein